MARPATTPSTLLDHLAQEPLEAWIPSAALDNGLELVHAARLSRPSLSDVKAVSVVAGGRGARRRAQLALRAGELRWACTCVPRSNGSPCEHVAALALLLTGEGAKRDDADSPVAASPLDEERSRRVDRGRSGLFTIRALRDQDAPYGTYEVRSPSGQTYAVVIRALDAPHNGCTCADFRTNGLGLCKHIVAVLDRVTGGRLGRARVEAAKRAGSPRSYLYLGYEPKPHVGLRLARRSGDAVARLARRWFDGDGCLRGTLVDAWPVLSLDAEAAGVEIPAEVNDLARRAAEARDRDRRQTEVESEVRRAGAEQAGFRGRLYPYQVDGVAFLVGRQRALLADDMGLGKTAQAIAAMARLFRKGEIQRALVVCPASLKHQWQQEIARFVDLPGVRTTVVSGTRVAREAIYANPGEVLISSYELVRFDEKAVATLAPDLLILDEAQRIKNWRTRTADVVKRLPTARAFVLTGTPLENRLDDLYSLMQVVDPHVLGPLWRFNRDFAESDERGRPVGYRNLGELRARLRPLFLRRRKEDVLDQLPERMDTRLVVPLDEKQRAIHDDAEGTAARLLNIVKRRPLSPIEEQRLMRAFQRMRMVCDAAALCGAPGKPRSAKLDELERLLDEICVQGGHKVVVFSEWEKMQALAAKVAQRLGVGHVLLNGGVPSARRGGLVARFREDPACKVFFSTDAGGVGLNLQAADHVINLDLPWNPAVLAQRIARVHRLGQVRPVNVVLMLAEASIESRMEGTLAAKRALFEAAIGDSTEDRVTRGSLASRIATILEGSFAAGTGSEPVPVAASADPVVELREQLGGALERVYRLADGRLVGVVADGAPMPAAFGALGGVTVLPAAAAAAMQAFGPTSPLAGAEVVYTAASAAMGRDDVRRGSLLAVAARKVACARALRDAGELGEALALLHAAMIVLVRAAAERDPGDDPATLLGTVYGDLVPAGVLTTADAHALARAGELTRAFATTPLLPPLGLVEPLFADVADLASRLREQSAPAPPPSPPAPARAVDSRAQGPN